MTNQEAIARIREHKIIHKMNEPRAIYISEALDMAIKSLENQKSTIEELEKIKSKINSEDIDCRYEDDYEYSGGLQKAIEIIDNRIAELKGEQE